MGFLSGKVCHHFSYVSSCGYCRMARNDEIMARNDKRQEAYYQEWKGRQERQAQAAKAARKAERRETMGGLAVAGILGLIALAQKPAESPVQAIAPAGWYTCPADARILQWWDGDAWTEHLYAPPGWYQLHDSSWRYWDGSNWIDSSLAPSGEVEVRP